MILRERVESDFGLLLGEPPEAPEFCQFKTAENPGTAYGEAVRAWQLKLCSVESVNTRDAFDLYLQGV